jgi:hypothetical protein
MKRNKREGKKKVGVGTCVLRKGADKVVITFGMYLGSPN